MFTYTVSTIAGPTGADRPTGHVDETGSEARFNLPRGVAVDSEGNVYVADYGNHRIRKLTKPGSGDSATYTVDTIAGPTSTECTSNNDACPSGFTDATRSAARFQNPSGVAVDSVGNVYVADFGNHRIRKIVYQ